MKYLFLSWVQSHCKQLPQACSKCKHFNEHTVWYAKSIQIVLLLLLDFGDFVSLLELGPASWLSSSFFTASW